MRTFIAKAVFDDGVTEAEATAEYSEALEGEVSGYKEKLVISQVKNRAFARAMRGLSGLTVTLEVIEDEEE